MFCPDLQKPVIVKHPSRQPIIDFDQIRTEVCHAHQRSVCPDSNCIAVLAYKSFLQAPYRTTASAQNQLNLCQVNVVNKETFPPENNAHDFTCQCLIRVTYSAAEFSLRISVIGLEQPSVSHCFLYNNDTFNTLKQKHGLNVNMSEFVAYLNNILTANQPPGDSGGVWYSLKLMSEQNRKKLLITENRPHRFLLFLSLESTWEDPDTLAKVLSNECLTRWSFSASLITAMLEVQLSLVEEARRADQARTAGQSQIAQLTQQLGDAKTDLTRALDNSSAIQNLRSQDSIVIKQLENQLQELREERNLLKERAEKSEQRITVQLAERESMALELRDLRRDLEQSHTQSDENESRFARSNELDQQLASAKAQVDRLMAVNEKLMIEHSSMSAKMAAITTELVELRRAHLAATEEQTRLLSEKASWQSAKAALEDACAASSVKASQYDLLVSERDELKRNCENLESDMRKLNLHMAKKLLSIPRPPSANSSGITNGGRFMAGPPRKYTNSQLSVSSEESDEYNESVDGPRPPLPLRSAASWAKREPSPTASAAPLARRSFKSNLSSQFTR